MGKMRKPFQGILNIVRFNWHLYVIALLVTLLLLFMASALNQSLQLLFYISSMTIFAVITLSLLASFYIYDLSGLYNLRWIASSNNVSQIVNLTAGFDETSQLLQAKFPQAHLLTLDFYDPLKHTEISIERARKMYLPFPGTMQVKTIDLKLPTDSVDKLFVIFSVHEIRDEMERILFFKELTRILKRNGEIYVTEHLRDIPNFLVYTIGFFHFYPKKVWLKTFDQAGLTVHQEIKFTPFVSNFVLYKNGNTL